MSRNCKAYGLAEKGAKLTPVTITRRAPAEDDVVVKIKYAGICHSDIHTLREEWGSLSYPQVVGHEIGGYVEEVGSKVTKFKVGDKVGVGCFVDSCRICVPCKSDLIQYCDSGCIGTYASKYKYPHSPEYTAEGGNRTQGGYSEFIVVNENYVVTIPDNLDLAAATPLLCAGITVYSPMRHFGLKPEHHFAVYGMGGLGHMGIKIAKAIGCKVTVISRGNKKKESSLSLGADNYIDSTDAEAIKAAANQFDFIINTVSGPHDFASVVGFLKFDGIVVMVGAGPEPFSIRSGALIGKRKRVAGSLVGGIGETQDMLNFCSQHNIVSEIELIKADQINEAYDRTVAGDVKYRFVIDVSTI